MRSLDPWQMLVLLGLAIQLLKLVLYGVANRRLNLRMLVTTNGLPSLHGVVFMAAAVTRCAMALFGHSIREMRSASILSVRMARCAGITGMSRSRQYLCA